MSKLTLSIDEKTIQKAKRISLRRGKSVSRIVKDYINGIPEKDSEENPLEEIMVIMKKYKTNIPLPKDGNYNRLANEMRYEDNLKKKK